MVTSCTRQNGRSRVSSRTISRAAVLLPTATLPASAIRNGTVCGGSRRNAFWPDESARLASTCSASSRASGT